jgi:hypothetical protein
MGGVGDDVMGTSSRGYGSPLEHMGAISLRLRILSSIGLEGIQNMD